MSLGWTTIGLSVRVPTPPCRVKPYWEPNTFEIPGENNVKSIAELSGLELQSREHAEKYFESYRGRIVDFPLFDDAFIPILRYLANATENETWTDFLARHKFTADHVDRADDIRRAIYSEDLSDINRKFGASDEEQLRLDNVFSAMADHWNPDTQDPVVLDVFTRLLQIGPCWITAPVQHNPDSADFLWSRVRCVIAGAGHKFHPQLTNILTDAYPQCPFLPNETREQWDTNLLQAHKHCGWPVHLGVLPWRNVVNCLTEATEKTAYIFTDWQRIVALLHVLKHVQVDETGEWLRVTYRGLASTSDLPNTSTVLGRLKLLTGDLTVLLGVPSTSKTKINPLAHAMKWALNHILVSHLRRRKALGSLPGTTLAGPWSTVSMAPTENEGFIQHGCRLSGVWAARDGRVSDLRGETDDIIGYDWNVCDAASEANAEARAVFESVLPKTYDVGYPSDLFFAAFPNITTNGMDNDLAVRCIFDAPIVASLIRDRFRALKTEFPLVAFLPESPTWDESTNQGKTLAALTFVRMLNPGIQSTVIATDSTSAPDNRAVVNQIRTDGTIALDEFHVPRAVSHPLQKDHLQSLCTGGAINAGEVLKNNPLPLRLKNSLVVAAKALDFGPDLRNRTFPFYLSELTDEQRSNGKVLETLLSGKLALQARLGMLAWIEQSNFIDALRGYERTSKNKGIRFGIHRAIARLLYAFRTGAEDVGEIDKTFEHMVAYGDRHTEAADDNGVLGGGKRIKISLKNFFWELTESEVLAMAQHIRGKQLPNVANGACVNELFVARMVAAQMALQPYYRLLEFINGSPARAGNRQLCTILGNEIKEKIAQGAGWRLPGHVGIMGWTLFRYVSGRNLYVWLEKVETQLNVAPGQIS